ncbi:hypothetical protein [uncultured phage_Deep1-GF2-KM23-C739]|uniref:Holin of 3TMs, for gene-transfer release n=1 Tax=uncultured phage_Deep1-GF2-KM23-C739 TaxID=2740798 RepID=A0A1B1IVZ4_9CAUD|nr:hypothetical protein HOU05_gp33 [uncultured phage_Deep1-GF2-KM23-C739]ANS05503.1 hypothetical protein [uncultured phage_Deep1-GF2-KM23-C739]
MLNFLLPIIKNPLSRLIISKTIDKVSHHLEREKIIRIREIEAAKTVSVENIKASSSSFRDELLTIIISAILICCFLPYTQPHMIKGFEIMRTAPTEFWWAVLIVFSGSFGINSINKFRNGKKK